MIRQQRIPKIAEWQTMHDSRTEMLAKDLSLARDEHKQRAIDHNVGRIRAVYDTPQQMPVGRFWREQMRNRRLAGYRQKEREKIAKAKGYPQHDLSIGEIRDDHILTPVTSCE